jgi:hypothetical protein
VCTALHSGVDTAPLQFLLMIKMYALALMYNLTLLQLGDPNVSNLALSCQIVVAGPFQ